MTGWESVNNFSFLTTHFLEKTHTVRSSHRWCSIKNMFLKISQNPREYNSVEVPFRLYQKDIQHRSFPGNITKFLR